jgi:hypothetical protein
VAVAVVALKTTMPVLVDLEEAVMAVVTQTPLLLKTALQTQVVVAVEAMLVTQQEALELSSSVTQDLSVELAVQ